MKPATQMKILNLYKGQSLKKAAYALEVAEQHVANGILAQRVRLVGMVVGD